MNNGIITLRQGREKPVRNQHPWVFSRAITHAANANPGDIVTLQDHKGAFLARGYWNSKSQIQLRLLTWQDEPIDDAWWRRLLTQACRARHDELFYQQGARPHAAHRLVNAENDYLPGLIVDRYGDWLVLQALTLGIEQRKHDIARLLAEVVPCKGIYERSDVDVRKREGLDDATGVLWGEAPPERIPAGSLLVDVRSGHKTGAYLDQMANMHLTRELVNQMDQRSRLLNLFSYTGGFALPALSMGGVHAINVDSSLAALTLAEQIVQHNGYHEQEHGELAEFIQADVFDYLHDAVKRGDTYEIVVLDPPKFAHNKQQVERAARGYKDLNLNAFKIIAPGGYLLTFSCSGAISADLFQKIVFGALADSGRQAQILQTLGPPPDHPVALTFPEGAYLKGLLLRVL